jgi:hypothetical protein
MATVYRVVETKRGNLTLGRLTSAIDREKLRS